MEYFLLLEQCPFIASQIEEGAKSKGNVQVVAALIAFIGTLIVALLTLYNNYKIRGDSKKAIKREEINKEISKYEAKLNEFYVPLRQYLENSKTLFKIFVKNKPANFRTLTYLLNQSQTYGTNNTQITLNKNDKSILEQILQIGEKIEALIYEKSYLIGDDKDFVQDYLPREGYSHIPYEQDMSLLSLLVSHIVVIRMAYNNNLLGEVDKFEGFVFPNEINVRVTEQIEKLEKLIENRKLDIAKL